MYIPSYFEPEPEDVRALLEAPGAADLITPTERGLLATFLPFLFDPPGSRSGLGPERSAGRARGPQQRAVARARDR